MRYFDKQTVIQSNNLSKKDIKEYIKKGCDYLDAKKAYKCYSLSNKSKVVVDDNKQILFFTYFDKIVDITRINGTRSNSEESSYIKIFLDGGALNPIKRGADVMIPGILKYIDRQMSFNKDDTVYIEVEEEGVYAVGIALMSMDVCKNKKEGIAIEILYYRKSVLDSIIH